MKKISIYTASFALILSIYLFNSCKKNKESTSVSDVDGNIYKIVTIGTQTWMAENLRTTKYSTGEVIGTTTPATLDISAIVNNNYPKYQWAYAGVESNVSTYGRLYSWYAVTDTRNICPTGWHVPSDSEWTTLTTFLGGENIAGGKLKDTLTIHWQSPNTSASNESGFTSLPGGFRDNDGSFYEIGTSGAWWCSSEYGTSLAWFRAMYYQYPYVYRSYLNKSIGCSIRCLKN